MNHTDFCAAASSNAKRSAPGRAPKVEAASRRFGKRGSEPGRLCHFGESVANGTGSWFGDAFVNYGKHSATEPRLKGRARRRAETPGIPGSLPGFSGGAANRLSSLLRGSAALRENILPEKKVFTPRPKDPRNCIFFFGSLGLGVNCLFSSADSGSRKDAETQRGGRQGSHPVCSVYSVVSSPIVTAQGKNCMTQIGHELTPGDAEAGKGPA
jgi:hypothetical protein